MTVDETISLHVTVIGGARYPNDFTMFWRGIPIGRIKKVGARHWWWGCNVNDRPSLDDDSRKAKFLIAWTRIRARLTKEDIAKAYVMPQR
jgi:hypothetical protein